MSFVGIVIEYSSCENCFVWLFTWEDQLIPRLREAVGVSRTFLYLYEAGAFEMFCIQGLSACCLFCKFRDVV